MPATRTSPTTQCTYCQQWFRGCGLAMHQAVCRQLSRDQRHDAKLEKRMHHKKKGESEGQERRKKGRQHQDDVPLDMLHYQLADPKHMNTLLCLVAQKHRDTLVQMESQWARWSSGYLLPMLHSIDDIKTEYHPNSKKPTRIDAFSDYCMQDGCEIKPPQISEPWQPFCTRANFELAEIAIDAQLNQDHIARIIDLIRRCVDGHAEFTLSGNNDLQRIWDSMYGLYNKFDKIPISTIYRDEEHSHDLYACSLWDWALDIARDQHLAPYFEWDAQRLSKFNGTCFERFVHEPWTGDRFWSAQSSIPSDGHLFGIILYADKSKLSSFRTQMGYPVVARCAHLPAEIRNGSGVGAGQVVGWLPIIKEDEEYKKKTDYIDFKRVVWHESVRKLMETVAEYSKIGIWIKCRDGIERRLFPIILILTADYEEHPHRCVMALTRGGNGLCPCPVCLIPKDKQSDFRDNYPARTMEHAQDLYQNAAAMSSAARQDEILKEESWRFAKNAFWDINLSDPSQTLSWDRMHGYAHGLGGKHILPQLQEFLLQSRTLAKKADTQ
ncbi:hypothetical protein DXG03_008069 [Asterophora parasitica]|uniref:Transposase n=1 Tax=Asterophora parasitica TaxID=117018 RepID=A0A9P7FXW3_9AGAR|nr:hypothetical protein DXG03_008069 [Asterophora parasitica]